MNQETKNFVEMLKEEVKARLALNQQSRNEASKAAGGKVMAISSEECKTLAETLEILKRLEKE